MNKELLTKLREISWHDLHRAFDNTHAAELAAKCGLPLCRVLVLTETSRKELIARYSNPELPTNPDSRYKRSGDSVL